MEIVTVKTKFQIVIPQHIREQVHIEIGDLLEAGVEGGKITFTPKALSTGMWRKVWKTSGKAGLTALTTAPLP